MENRSKVGNLSLISKIINVLSLSMSLKKMQPYGVGEVPYKHSLLIMTNTKYNALELIQNSFSLTSFIIQKIPKQL